MFVEMVQAYALHCQVDSEAIKRFIIARCSLNELRQKAFEKSFNLEQLIRLGNSIETYENSLKEIVSSSTASLPHVNPTQEGCWNSGRSAPEEKQCSRCGSVLHEEYSLACHARNVRCDLCSKIGHFARKCHSLKRRSSDDLPTNKMRKVEIRDPKASLSVPDSTLTTNAATISTKSVQTAHE